MEYVVIIGIIQAFFFGMLALTKRNKQIADYILATLFMLLTYQLMVNYVMMNEELRYEFPHVIGTAGPLTLLYGPLLFFFIKHYITERHSFKPIYLLHVVPFVWDVVDEFFKFYLQPAAEKIQDLEEIMSGKPDADLALFLVIRSMHPIIYCFWSLKVLSVHRGALKKLYSFTSDRLTLNWLWYLSISMSIVSVSAFVLNTFIILFDFADFMDMRRIILYIGVIWVFFLGIYSIRWTPFYQSYKIKGIDTLEFDKISKQPEKYEKTRLKEDDIPELRKKLQDHLEAEKPYLNKNLSIGELSEAIEVPTYQLSQLINDQLGKSFFELINSYRVEEVKKRFFDPKYSNLTLLGIAMECGFNSKASFNRIFKQLTGQTPTEYIKTKKAA